MIIPAIAPDPSHVPAVGCKQALQTANNGCIPLYCSCAFCTLQASFSGTELRLKALHPEYAPAAISLDIWRDRCRLTLHAPGLL